MDYRCQNCIILSTLHKAIANLRNHNLFLIFVLMRQIKLNSLKFFPDSEKIRDFMTFPGSLEFHEISRFPDFCEPK